ncbi:sugar kinase [Hyaloraphidium curvatum]|nr:sugar kinase [Hyaloraphidium curvatum]
MSGGEPPTTVLVTGGVLLDIFLGLPPAGLPPPGGAALVSTILPAAGGCAANTASCLALLLSSSSSPLRVHAWARNAKGGAGAVVRAELDSNGVDAEKHWIDDPRWPVKTAAVLLSPGGDRSFLKTAGMGNAICRADFDAVDWTRVRHLHVGGNLSLRNVSGADLAEGIGAARAANPLLTVSLDTVASSDPARWCEVLPSLPFVDCFLPSLDEARAITGAKEGATRDPTEEECVWEPGDVARWFHARGSKVVCIKMGAEGALLSEAPDGDEPKQVRIPAHPVESVVDTTGAGDAFCAGFIHGLLHGRTLENCTVLGTLCGAAAVGALGSTNGVKDWTGTEDAIAALRGINPLT